MVWLILIGLACCIAMALAWNDLAEGSSEYGADLLSLNNIFQVFTYSFYAWIFITVLPPYFGFEGAIVDISIGTIAESAPIYLGITFAMGIFSRLILVKLIGMKWYKRNFFIYRNILEKTNGGDKVLIIFGQGHISILKHLLEDNPKFELVTPIDYLKDEIDNSKKKTITM